MLISTFHFNGEKIVFLMERMKHHNVHDEPIVIFVDLCETQELHKDLKCS